MYYTEWYNEFSRRMVRSPSFDRLEDLLDYMAEYNPGGHIYTAE